MAYVSKGYSAFATSSAVAQRTYAAVPIAAQLCDIVNPLLIHTFHRLSWKIEQGRTWKTLAQASVMREKDSSLPESRRSRLRSASTRCQSSSATGAGMWTPMLTLAIVDAAKHKIELCGWDRMFIKWQPPKGENDDYDNENFWISGWLPSRRRKEKGRRREKDERPTQRHIVTGDVS